MPDTLRELLHVSLLLLTGDDGDRSMMTALVSLAYQQGKADGLAEATRDMRRAVGVLHEAQRKVQGVSVPDSTGHSAH